MIRLGFNDRSMMRAIGRLALLCACAIAAISAEPALAAPEDGGAFGPRVEASEPDLNLRARPDLRLEASLETQRNETQLISPSLMVRGETFDIKVDPAVSDRGREDRFNRDDAAAGDAVASAALLPATVAPSAVQVEQLLVSQAAPPPASDAHIENGAIVLTSAVVGTAAANAPLAVTSTSTGFEYAGSTLGCFGAGCTPVAYSTLNGLSFTGGTFQQVAGSEGFSAISNLGLLSQNGTSASYFGTAFSLLVNFTSPTVTSGTIAALLIGDVSGANTGGVQFNFTNPTQTFAFSGGTFSLTLNNVAVSSSAANAPISGFIRGPAAPPPPPIVELAIPRDDVVLSVADAPPPKKDSDVEVLDLTQLASADDLFQIDTGVTSGADSTTWDEISIERDGQADACIADGGKDHHDDTPKAAVCREPKH